MKKKKEQMDIYDANTVKYYLNEIERIRRTKAKGVFVCLHGPAQCGKKTLASFLGPLVESVVEPLGLEVRRVDIAVSKPNWGSPFVSAQLFCSTNESPQADINIFVPCLFSENKLKAHLGIKIRRLKQLGYDIPSAMCTNIYSGTDLERKITALFEKLYSRRCTTSMDRIAFDTDTICFMDVYTGYGMCSDIPLNKFIESRPHVHSVMQTLCGMQLQKKTLLNTSKKTCQESSFPMC